MWEVVLRPTRFEIRSERFAELLRAEAAGEVADSNAVRVALIEKMDAGLLTLAEVQAELKRIKRNASKAGKATRAGIMSGRRQSIVGGER